MFERFTDRARRAIVLGQEDARGMFHNYIGTEHILLGLTHEGEGIAALALKSLGISLEVVRAEVEAMIGRGQFRPSGHIPFTPRAKKVLELSLREALQLGHNYIGTEHILLGLIREGEGVACQILVKSGAELTTTRQEVIKILSGVQKEPAAKTPATPEPMKHDTPENREIADNNTVLRINHGSRLYGTSIDTSDRDELGICVEPPDYVIGLKQFEQYEHRPSGQHGKCGPDDLDITCYSLRKWARLVAAGNPNLLSALFAQGADVLDVSWPGHDLRSRRYMFLSRTSIATTAIGYLEGRRNALLGRTDEWFDAKLTYHGARIGMQTVELLSTGAVTLPFPEPNRTTLIDLRNGKYTKEEAAEIIESCRHQLTALEKTSKLPEHPDYSAINSWLNDTYIAWWDEHR